MYNTIFYLLGMIVGTITFTGSLTACAKLEGIFLFLGYKINRKVPIRGSSWKEAL